MSPILPGDRPRLSARARLQKDKLTGKPIVLYPEGVLILNPTAHAILSLCTGQETLQNIVSSLSERYQVSPEALRPDVLECLDRLRSRNLLEVLSEESATS
jgi:pyrroloquinoline quinone biosynthesis protein D